VSLVTALTVLCGSQWTPVLLRETHPAARGAKQAVDRPALAQQQTLCDWPASSLVLLHGSELLNVLQTRTPLPTIRYFFIFFAGETGRSSIFLPTGTARS